MNEQHYQRVVNYLPHWRPSRINRNFTVSNVMDITDVEAIKSGEPGIGFLEAYAIHGRLKEENLIPKGLSEQ